MGPSWLVLISFPLGMGPSQRAFHGAIDGSESVLSTSSDISSIDEAALRPLPVSTSALVPGTKDRAGWEGAEAWVSLI